MNSPKRSRVAEEDTGSLVAKKVSTARSVQEEGHPLVRLVEQRRSDVTELVEHIARLRAKLVVARKKSHEASTLLKQLQAQETDCSGVPEEPDSFRISEDGGKDLLQGRQGSLPVGSLACTLPEHLPPSIVLSIPGGSSRTSSGSGRGTGDLFGFGDGVAGGGVLSGQADADTERTSGRASLSGHECTSPEERLHKEHVNLTSCVKTSDMPLPVCFNPPVYVPSQRKRKLRCLEVNPVAENQCATTALDGQLCFWRIDGPGHSFSLQHTVDCLSPSQKRWPEDVDWHPSGESLVACYSADAGDSQVSIISNTERRTAVFLPDKPHGKGIINGIVYLPWSNGQDFATGGCDHAVVLWKRRDGKADGWQPKVLHRTLHTSAVMGIASLRHKEWILSSGADKRVFGYDLQAANAPLSQLLETKVINVVPNPVDFNIYLAQTGAPGLQIKLFDIRSPGSYIHNYGWYQDNGESQTALIRSSWSPDGLYTVTGSTDPKIHIFDIRYIRPDPVKIIKAHTKRVFKAKIPLGTQPYFMPRTTLRIQLIKGIRLQNCESPATTFFCQDEYSCQITLASFAGVADIKARPPIQGTSGKASLAPERLESTVVPAKNTGTQANGNDTEP